LRAEGSGFRVSSFGFELKRLSRTLSGEPNADGAGRAIREGLGRVDDLHDISGSFPLISFSLISIQQTGLSVSAHVVPQHGPGLSY
jgi:hypothetical protein